MRTVLAWLAAEPGPCRGLWLIPLALLAIMLGVALAALILAVA